jgi:4-nitrophenyl phosphatase
MEDGIAPGVGALILALEAASDQKATIIGKPQPAMFETALQILGIPAAEALAVGDRLDTDILGANRAGVPSALVLTGVTSPEQAEVSEIRATVTFDDLPHLLATWQAEVHGA